MNSELTLLGRGGLIYLTCTELGQALGKTALFAYSAGVNHSKAQFATLSEQQSRMTRPPKANRVAPLCNILLGLLAGLLLPVSRHNI